MAFPHRVTIQSATETTSTSGAVTADWGTPILVGTRWATIDETGGREVYQARAINPEVDAIIKLSGGHLAVTAKMRVTHADGRHWDILVVRTSDGKTALKSREIVLECVRGLRQGA